MLSNISSHLRVRWRSSTNTQGLPRYRLPIMPSQNVSSHVPGRHSNTLREMTHDAHPAFAAFVGLDWADVKHDVCLQTASSTTCECFQLEHTPEAIDAWVTTLRTRFNGQPVAICLELHKGPIVSALRKYDFLV